MHFVAKQRYFVISVRCAKFYFFAYGGNIETEHENLPVFLYTQQFQSTQFAKTIL